MMISNDEKKIRLLDCTLRDGGYVNNWEFDTRKANAVISGLYDAGIRIIEIGITGKNTIPGKQTLFRNFEEMEPLLQNRKSDCMYSLMMNVSDFEYYAVPSCSEKTVDCIRLAFFKSEWEKAMKNALELKNKGYKVWLQAMATFMYSDEEFEILLAAINDFQPYAFYMVDSFGTFFNEDVRKMAQFVDSRLSTSVYFGFHAHNNMQMAFSNVIVFLQSIQFHRIIIDGSIFGMGRGAGNAPIELLIEYINTHFQGSKYSVEPVEAVFDQEIRELFDKYHWGYSLEYFTTSRYHANSAYGWYLGIKGIKSIKDFDTIVKAIPDDIRFRLDKKVANELIEALSQGEKA